MASINKQWFEFSNVCANFGAHDNDTCMRPFVNSLEGRDVANVFDFPDNFFSNWFELMY